MWSGGANKLDKKKAGAFTINHRPSNVGRVAPRFISISDSVLCLLVFLIVDRRKFNDTEVSWPTRRLWLESRK